MRQHFSIDLPLDDWSAVGGDVPLLVNLQPAGAYLGEDYHHAGGVPAIIKMSVIGPEFRQRYLSNPRDPDAFECTAVVFEGPEDYHARIDDPALGLDESSMLVIRGAGPIGYPGAAEKRPPAAISHCSPPATGCVWICAAAASMSCGTMRNSPGVARNSPSITSASSPTGVIRATITERRFVRVLFRLRIAAAPWIIEL